MTPPPETPHVDPVPPLTGWAKIRKHIVDWATAYFWLPVGLLGVWFFAKIAYWMTGYEPQENMDWVVQFSWNIVRCILLVFFVEIYTEQTGKWWTKDELKECPRLYLYTTISKCSALIVFAYLLSR